MERRKKEVIVQYDRFQLYKGKVSTERGDAAGKKNGQSDLRGRI